MMVVTRQSTCYIFVLTSSEMAMVHADDSLRKLEVSHSFSYILQHISHVYVVIAY